MRDHPPLIQLPATAGIFLKKLTRIRPPRCTYCIYGSMTRKQWQVKTSLTHHQQIRPAAKSDEQMPVDQITVKNVYVGWYRD
eukprot:110844-Ditylum_brightwellii.AAC.1